MVEFRTLKKFIVVGVVPVADRTDDGCNAELGVVRIKFIEWYRYPKLMPANSPSSFRDMP